MQDLGAPVVTVRASCATRVSSGIAPDFATQNLLAVGVVRGVEGVRSRHHRDKAKPLELICIMIVDQLHVGHGSVMLEEVRDVLLLGASWQAADKEGPVWGRRGSAAIWGRAAARRREARAPRPAVRLTIAAARRAGTARVGAA